MKKKIIHIVPSLQVGGVEIGIQNSFNVLNEYFDYRIIYVVSHGCLKINQCSIAKYLFLLILRKTELPDIVITSLWKAHPLGALLKILGIKWIAFFHNTKAAHIIDGFIQEMSWTHASHRFVDSAETGKFLCKKLKKNFFIIPYIFTRLASNNFEKKDIDFIWVGRNSPVKRIDILINFIKLLELKLEKIKIYIIVANGIPKEILDMDVLEYVSTNLWLA